MRSSCRRPRSTETSTGIVRAWDPPRRLEVTWQSNAEWRFDPGMVTVVDVRFDDAGDGRTRVQLEHRDLEAFGPQAEKMRETFEAPGAWDATLAALTEGVREAMAS